MARYEYAIGTTVESMQYLFQLKVKAPKQAFNPYSRLLSTNDGGEDGTGWPVAEWYYSFLTQTERDTLKTFCPGQSADVYVRTLNDDLEWTTYRAKMLWQFEAPEINNNATIRLTLRFRLLEVIT
jgi:hypothetical protein